MWKGSNLDTANWSRTDILNQINNLSYANARLIRFPVMLDARAMASWTIDQYWAWFKDVCQVFEDISPTLIANQQPAIFDHHHPVGGFKNNKWQLFYSDTLMAEHVKMVAYAANRFKGNPAYAACEPFNEPAPRSSAQLRSAYDSIIAAVRATGYNGFIVIDHRGSDCANMKGAKPFNGVGPMMYSAHLYHPAAVLQPNGKKFTITKDQIRSYMKYPIRFARDYGADMVVGEFGCLKSSGGGTNQGPWIQTCVDVFKDLNREMNNRWSWCFQTESYDPNSVFKISDAQFQTLWK